MSPGNLIGIAIKKGHLLPVAPVAGREGQRFSRLYRDVLAGAVGLTSLGDDLYRAFRPSREPNPQTRFVIFFYVEGATTDQNRGIFFFDTDANGVESRRRKRKQSAAVMGIVIAFGG